MMKTSPEMKWHDWLWRPFYRVAGMRALMLGLPGMLLGVVLALLFDARFDGVLNIHFVPEVHTAQVIGDVLITWLSLSSCLYIAAKLGGTRLLRFIDIAGTALLAMLPYFLLPLVNIAGNWSDLARTLEDENLDFAKFMEESSLLPFLLGTLILLALLIWHLSLLYNAFKVSSHIAKRWRNISFISSLVAAMFLSIFLIHQYNQAL